MSWYSETKCESLDQFLRELDNTRDANGNDERVYRGQACSSWDLRPTLYRQRYGNMLFEIAVVDAFMIYSHRNGLLIPPDAMSYVSRTDNTSGSSVRIYQTSDGKAEYDIGNIAFAMARHAEIPTRHLDFTWDPLVATYFAVNSIDEDVVKIGKMLPKRLAVWAIHRGKLFHNFGLIHHDWTNIPSLRNQKGLFVYDSTLKVTSMRCWTEAPSFDVALSRLGDANMTKKITLESTDSNIIALRDYLKRRGITTQRMFPTYENARDAVMSRYENPNPA